MKYFSAFPSLKRSERRALLANGELTKLDKVILQKAENGSDIMGLISCSKPYVNEWGSKEWANTDRVVKSVNKLVKMKLLVRR